MDVISEKTARLIQFLHIPVGVNNDSKRAEILPQKQHLLTDSQADESVPINQPLIRIQVTRKAMAVSQQHIKFSDLQKLKHYMTTDLDDMYITL